MTDWESHYQANDTPWDKGEPSPALLEALEFIPVSGRVLVPGSGLGHDVRALASRADEVVGLDLSPSAVAAARALPVFGQERYEAGDLFALPEAFREAFDWVFEHTCFCAIPRERRPDYVTAVADALRPGGRFLGVFYVDPGQEHSWDGPPFETTLIELDRLFEPRFELEREWLPQRTYPNRAGREWMRVWRRR
jgi:SAM-dependent methyltransferase